MADPFSMLFNQSTKDGREDRGGGESNRRKKLGLFNKASMNKKSSNKNFRASRAMSENMDENYQSMDDDDKEKKKNSEDLSENAEEDIRAQMLMSKEEEENALFKRIF